MQLPLKLRRAIDDHLERCDPHVLNRAVTELSETYRRQRPAKGRFITSDTHRLTYLATRLPATYAAVHAVLSETRRLIPDRKINSLLDLGAGPGTASWVATEIFDTLGHITLIEQDEGLIQLGTSLAQAGENTRINNADWIRTDLRTSHAFSTHDLVICSYALGELTQPEARNILNTAWSAANIALVIIEPGTVPGFDLIRHLRNDLISKGAHLIAPCPHHQSCPMASEDWCHFSQRVERSALHRHMKTGTLGYEDEKFTYIAAAKHPTKQTRARILRHPQRRSGHTHLLLCTQDGLQNRTVTRSDKKNWKRVRKINWGDAWE